jgi:DNA-binding response OmpR family regulator
MSKVLLLEDDEALALGIEFTLRDEGYDVKVCKSAADAVMSFSNDVFDIALLDIMLPDGNGYDVCRYIRSKSQLPVIFLTACDNEVNVVLGLDIGADDYITKPFRVRELISRIKAVLRRFEVKGSKEKFLKSGDIVLNTETAKVYKKGSDISLSSQEYRLILIFMTNPKVLMSREEILHRLIEGAEAYFDTNTLSVYIKRIREKIEDDCSAPVYIKTRRGLGYEWDPEVEKE